MSQDSGGGNGYQLPPPRTSETQENATANQAGVGVSSPWGETQQNAADQQSYYAVLAQQQAEQNAAMQQQVAAYQQQMAAYQQAQQAIQNMNLNQQQEDAQQQNQQAAYQAQVRQQDLQSQTGAYDTALNRASTLGKPLTLPPNNGTTTWGDIWNGMGDTLSANDYGLDAAFPPLAGVNFFQQAHNLYLASQGGVDYSAEPYNDPNNQPQAPSGLSAGGARFGVGNNPNSRSPYQPPSAPGNQGPGWHPSDQIDRNGSAWNLSSTPGGIRSERVQENAQLVQARDEYLSYAANIDRNVAQHIYSPEQGAALKRQFLVGSGGVADLLGQVNNNVPNYLDPNNKTAANVYSQGQNLADALAYTGTTDPAGGGSAVGGGLLTGGYPQFLTDPSAGTRTGTGTGTGSSLDLEKLKLVNDTITSLRDHFLAYSKDHYYGSAAGIGFIGPQGAGQWQRLPEPPIVSEYYAAHPELGPDPLNYAAPFTGYTGSTYVNPQHAFAQAQPVGQTQDFSPPPVVGDASAAAGDTTGAGTQAHAAAASQAYVPLTVGSGYNQPASGLPHVPYGPELTGESGYGATITPNGTPVPLSPWQQSGLDPTSLSHFNSYVGDIAGWNPADLQSVSNNMLPQNVKAPGAFTPPNLGL